MTGSRPDGACYLAAVRLLAGRDFTCRALQTRLEQRGYSAAEAQSVVERLQQEGYLDDRRLAERLVATARSDGRFTGHRLRQELLRRGVASPLAEELLQNETDAEPVCEQVRSLVERRYGISDFSRLDERMVRRVTGFLQRRGYGYSAIRQLLQPE